ncbi:MAG: GAF domain-containing protein [Elusimicrobia bacterium]|nr:GAF domain-containing protein [Elusimicrobiota bacterium]
MDAAGLFEIAEELTSSTDLDTVLGKIGLVGKKLLNCEASSIMLFDDTRKNLYFKVATGDKGMAIKKLIIPVGVGVAGWVAQNLQPLVIGDVTRDARFAGQFDKTSGFVTKSLLCVPMFFKGEPLGIVEMLNKINGQFTQEDQMLLTHLASFASIAISNARLVHEQRNFFAHILEVLAISIESIGPRFVGRPWRCQRQAAYLGRRLGLSAKELADLAHASLLYDIGFLAEKNTRYMDFLSISRMEYKSSEGSLDGLHSVLAEKMLSGVELFKGAIPIIRHHHECMDGSGTPDHLKGEAIPLGARIIAVVDTAEDIRYQLRGVPREQLLGQLTTELQSLSSIRLDPQVVKAYLEMLQEEEMVYE